VAIATVPPLELELELVAEAEAPPLVPLALLEDELVDPHAATRTAKTAAARPEASRLRLLCI
jgi:hypothetical protein